MLENDRTLNLENPNLGFSLIELMVVVGIVGILATLAIPAYDKFVEKARQTEAKVALATIYTGEMGFKAASGSFTYCLDAIGFGTDNAKRYYGTGFYGVGGVGMYCSSCGPQNNSSCLGYEWSGSVATSSCPTTKTHIDPTIFAGPAVTLSNVQLEMISVNGGVCPDITSQSFSLRVAGSISKLNTIDVWSINEKKNLSHIK